MPGVEAGVGFGGGAQVAGGDGFRAVELVPAQQERAPLGGVVVELAGFLGVGEEAADAVVFEQSAEQARDTRAPVLEVLRAHPRTVLLAAGSFLATNATFYVGSTWIVSYATTALDYERTSILNANALLAFADIPLMLGLGLLSDRIGRRGMSLAGMAGLAVFAVPYFLLVDSGSIGLFLLGGLVVQVCRTAVYGPQSAMYAELFSTRFRYSGASLAYQIAAILGGGIAPMICTALYRWTGTSMAIAGYTAVLCVISFAASYLLAETYRRRLTDSGVEPATT